jgi:hypothetical protein
VDAVALVTRRTFRFAGFVAGVLALVMTRPRTVDAHPIHTTLTVLTPDASGHSVTLNIRTFADDFSASVARFAGRAAPRDSSAAADDVVRYVRSRVRVTDLAGTVAAIAPCGVRRARELYWLCFTVSLPGGVRGARINNQLLTELHADQVNIVQLESKGSRKSYLFTRESQAGVLAQ